MFKNGGELEALTELHSGFVADHADWHERVEVGYISHAVLQTLGESTRQVVSPSSAWASRSIQGCWSRLDTQLAERVHAGRDDRWPSTA